MMLPEADLGQGKQGGYPKYRISKGPALQTHTQVAIPILSLQQNPSVHFTLSIRAAMAVL